MKVTFLVRHPWTDSNFPSSTPPSSSTSAAAMTALLDAADTEPDCCEVCLVASRDGLALMPCTLLCKLCEQVRCTRGTCRVYRMTITMVIRIFLYVCYTTNSQQYCLLNYNRFHFAPVGVRSIVINPSVCLSVCPRQLCIVLWWAALGTWWDVRWLLQEFPWDAGVM